jgi:hypothetical protein
VMGIVLESDHFRSNAREGGQRGRAAAQGCSRRACENVGGKDGHRVATEIDTASV